MGSMPELQNSSREFLQATYAPVVTEVKIGDDGDGGNGQPPIVGIVGRPWEKSSFVASLKPSNSELSELKRHIAEEAKEKGPKKEDHKAILKSIKIIESTQPGWETYDGLRSIKLFRDIQPATLIHIADRLIKIRQEKVDSIIKEHKSILDTFHRQQIHQERSKPAK